MRLARFRSCLRLRAVPAPEQNARSHTRNSPRPPPPPQQAVLRAIFGYFIGAPSSDIPRIDIPLHTLIGGQWGGGAAGVWFLLLVLRGGFYTRIGAGRVSLGV